MATILLVEDDTTIRKQYKKFLLSKGFKVLEAPDAIEVTNCLLREKSNLDLILLDINFGEIDGRDIFDIVDEYAPNIKIIVTSVLPIQEQKIRIPRSSDYFNKADSEKGLLDKINRVLGIQAGA